MKKKKQNPPRKTLQQLEDTAKRRIKRIVHSYMEDVFDCMEDVITGLVFSALKKQADFYTKRPGGSAQPQSGRKLKL